MGQMRSDGREGGGGAGGAGWRGIAGWRLVLGLALVAGLAGCGDDDGGSPDARPSDGDAGDNPACVDGWIDPNACLTDDSCDPPADVRLSLSSVESFQAGVDSNPEIVRLIPGSDRGAFSSAAARQVTLFTFDASGFTPQDPFAIPAAPDMTEVTSISIAPSGAYAAVTRADLGSVKGCDKGAVLLIDLVENPGALLKELEVGYNPDSAEFSANGEWLVAADEDDREDRPCKPAERHGGSATIIDVSDGPDAATVVQTLLIDHDVDSEPEGVKIAPDNDTVLIAIQETSEVGIFQLADVPNATLRRVALPAESNPDGMAIADDGSFAIISNEFGDSFSVLALPAGTITTTYVIRGSGDVPDTYNRDDRATIRVHEPEEVVLIRQGGAIFAALNLQESHALIAYNLADLANPAFDSITETGIGWEAEASGREASNIGPEGLAARASAGVLFGANEREGSVTMYKTAFSQACE